MKPITLIVTGNVNDDIHDLGVINDDVEILMVKDVVHVVPFLDYCLRRNEGQEFTVVIDSDAKEVSRLVKLCKLLKVQLDSFELIVIDALGYRSGDFGSGRYTLKPANFEIMSSLSL